MTRVAAAAVTGASGFLGRALLERLPAGEGVRALFRRDDERSRSWVARGGAVVLGSLADAPALDALVRNVDTVYHCAATMAKGDARLGRQVNVEGTERLARAAAEAGVGRFVYVSSISVFAATVRPDGTITEAIEPENAEKLNPYSRTKLEGELRVRAVGSDAGLPYTIIRPTNIYGPGSGPWFHQFERLLRRVPLAIGDFQIDIVYVDDVVEALIAAAQSPAAANRVFHVGHEMVRLNRFIREVARVIGRPARPLPPALDRAARLAIDRLYRVFTGTRMSMSLLGPVAYPHEDARRAFGYVPAIPMSEGFRRLAAWYRSLHSTDLA